MVRTLWHILVRLCCSLLDCCLFNFALLNIIS
nr:MAG TPA: hypothetical protein [Caudoviricetes sp.]